MALADTAKLTVELALRDRLTGGLRSATGKLRSLDKATSNTQRSLAKTAHNVERFGIGVATATVGLLGAAIKVAGDFEAQLNTINTVARQSPEGLKAIGEQIRGIARATGTPLEELTQGYYDLVSAGIKAADAQQVLANANTLAIGGLASAAETVDLLTTAINTYGGDASKATAYTDAFAKAIERGKVTAAEIAGSFAQVGPIAAASSIEINEVAAAYARLTQAGVPAAEAATQMRSAIVALTRRTGDLKKLEKQTGKSYLQIAGKKGLVFALQELRKDADKAGVPLIDLLGRVEGLNFTLQTTGPNFDAYNADLAAVGDSAGTAAEQMAERQKGLNYQLARLKALAKDAGITIGSALLPKLTPLVEKLNTFLSENQDKIADFGQKLADGFTKLADGLGKVDWRAIGGGLEITGRAAKTLVDAFLALPPDVQKLAVAALAINKVTGGLPTSIVKDLAGLALRSLTTINAANVTVVGGSVTGGGLPVGGKGGVGAGTILTATLAIPAAIMIANAIKDAAGISDEENTNRQNRGQFGPRSAGQKVPGSGFTGQVKGIGRGEGFTINPKSFTPGIARVQASLATLRERLAKATATGHEKTAAKIRAKIDEEKAVLARLKAQQASADARIATRMGVTNAKLGAQADILAAIRAKKTQFRTTVNVHAQTTVSVRNVNNSNRTSNRYSSRSMNQAL